MTTNCIKFTSADIETAKGVGSISTLTFDLDITVEPVASTNPMAPTHRVLGNGTIELNDDNGAPGEVNTEGKPALHRHRAST